MTIDEAGEVQELVTSGLTPDEDRQLEAWSEGPHLFEHFRALPGTLRVQDLHAYVRSLGFSTELMRSQSTLLGTPLRHRGVHVGVFFVADKEGGPEFTDEDEKIVALFASQAAAAIVNARAYASELRARANLEALIETSPVGVVVFDARSGNPVSINRATKRIVQGLRTPDLPLEESLRRVTCHRADGEQVGLSDPRLAQRLSSGETVRAEEVELSVPDGRRVSALVNVTPIRAADGAVDSVVVTLQDLAPLREVDRQRTEFLSMVSHELQAPLTSIKGSAATALSAAQPTHPAEMLQLFRIVDKQADHMRGLISDLLDHGRIEAGMLSVTPEPAALAALVDQARNAFLGSGGGQAVRIDLPPDLPRVMADRQRIVQVLGNLLANASRHAPESSTIRVDAVRDGTHVAVSVSDRGRGIPPDQLPRLFQKYAGLARSGGYGLGLAICKGLVEAHGGRIRAASAGLGRGAVFTFTLPVADEADASHDVAAGPSRPARDGGAQKHVLVVDDDPQTLRHVREALTAAGFVPLATGDPGELPDLLATKKPSLVLLDLLLPETDGIELLTRIPALADLPVIFMSVYDRDETIARALDAGAADYLVKPFSATELTARVRAVLRRRAEPDAFLLGDVAVHYEQRRVTVAGRQVRLTATEYELLRVLSTNAGRV